MPHVQGYIALKLQNFNEKPVLNYIDWSNTIRRYNHPKNFTKEEREDFRRAFESKNVFLLYEKDKLLPILKRELKLSDFHGWKCIDITGRGSLQNLMNNYFYKNKKKKSFYNYRRDHWLSILSHINIHILEKGKGVSYNEILSLIHEGLCLCKRNDMPETDLFNYYVEFGMLKIIKDLDQNTLITLP